MEILAALGYGAKELFSYNRENFKFDQDQRIERETLRLEMQVKRFELFREDVHDLVELTVDRMDVYHLVGALFLEFCVVLFCEGRIQGSAPPFLLSLFLLSNACAFIYLLLAVWLSMHASIAAHSFGVRLLTRFVRLPIPSIKQISALKSRLKDYESQGVGNLLRLPFQEKQGDWKQVPEGGARADGGPGDLPGPGPAAAPLLKFPGDRPVLSPEGLAALEALPGPVRPVAFVGDGRSGKSYLASRLCGAGVFATDDSDVAVTEGIDLAALANEPGHLLVLDCEGGNNALSRSHSIVTVVAALVATCLVFVTDGKASEAAVEALARMLQERSLIKCDGTGALHAQSLVFVVNQNRLRYSEDALERILAAETGPEARELRGLIGEAYPEERRHFFAVPTDSRADFAERWAQLEAAVGEAAGPLRMGRLWMTGAQVAQMLRKVEQLLQSHGKVSLPSLHRHVILDGWLRPTVGQVLGSRMDKLLGGFSEEELRPQRAGQVTARCQECKAEAGGWLDPDVEEFFCEACWRVFSPSVLKCGFCMSFHPWPRGRVEQVTRMWHCLDCLMQLGIDAE